MKLANPFIPLCPRRRAFLLAAALLGFGFAVTAPADVEVARRWAGTAPTIDGVVAPGEWNAATATAISVGGTTYAQMRTMNDGTYLYLLLDVVDDTHNDPWNTTNYTGDFFAIYVDKDLNHAVTPYVDFFYSGCNSGAPFVKAYRIDQSGSSGCTATDPNSQGVEGFGSSLNSATPHRIWEFRFTLTELGVDASTWTTSAGSLPKVRLNVAISSVTPAFYIAQPDPNTSPDNSLMYQVDLATSPAFPPGSTGPIFAGVGLVPSTYIDGAGYANLNLSGYYYATNAPFGGNLNVFGNWNTLRFAYGARRYRVLYSKDGGPYTRLKQTWTNFKFNGLTWVPNAIGPDADDAYPVPVPWEIWYLPNLLISWQTAAGFADGTYRLRLELLNASGIVLASPPGNNLTLLVDNTPPTVNINNAFYLDGSTTTPICECGIVTQGACSEFVFPRFTFRGLSFDITVNDPRGALSSYSLGYTYGNNVSGGIGSDSYAPGHVNQDGPEQWIGVGVTNQFILPSFPPFCAPKSCAYTFILSAQSRVQNGYGLVFPYTDYKKSLTILVGSGAGSISCP